MSRRELSSQVDASSTKEDDDLEDGLSALDTHGNNNGSGTDLSDGDEDVET